MATYTAVLVVPDEVAQDDVIGALEAMLGRVWYPACGQVAFLGPGSLVQDIGDDGEPVRECVSRPRRS